MNVIYQNPVWDADFADPFVLHWRGAYYAYGTSGYARPAERGGHAFPVLRSTDLARWEYAGGVLAAADGVNFWAPAVAERDGRFFLYYSAGRADDDTTHRLAVAVADHPAGPFDALGPLLPTEGFSIDAHPFRDPADGRWYLYFCKDYFDERVGTGIAGVPLADTMDRVAGDVVTILRPSADWHIYERDRALYSQRWPAWHTVEGPCVVERAGLYYCFYSGGAWHSDEYGVSYGVADRALGAYHDEWSSEGPAVLRARPGVVTGPGHNSIILGPNGKTDFIVYHAWNTAHTMRRMCIDPLAWTPDGPRCLGPSNEPRELEV